MQYLTEQEKSIYYPCFNANQGARWKYPFFNYLFSEEDLYDLMHCNTFYTFRIREGSKISDYHRFWKNINMVRLEIPRYKLRKGELKMILDNTQLLHLVANFKKSDFKLLAKHKSLISVSICLEYPDVKRQINNNKFETLTEDDSGIQQLIDSRHIRFIDMNSSYVDINILKSFSKSFALLDLNLFWTATDNDSIKELFKSTSLTYLNVSETPATEDVLKYIQNNRSLTKFDMNSNYISISSVLKHLVPNNYIVHYDVWNETLGCDSNKLLEFKKNKKIIQIDILHTVILNFIIEKYL